MSDCKPHGDCPPPYSAHPGGPVNVTVVEDVHGCGTTYVQQPVVAPPPCVVVTNACPVCHVGVLENEFTGCGICLAICFFPLGLICCLLMQERRCTHCRVSYAG